MKRRSPSIVRFRRQEPPAALAAVYHEAGAAALSLVTDRPNFGTGPGDIRPMRDAVPLPLVAKDFVIDPWQLLALRAAGADCVLLIARLLDGAQLADLHAEAAELGLAALVECHDEDDVTRALAAGAALVGINNRDLDTFAVSLDTSRRLLRGMPTGTAVVVESDIAGRAGGRAAGPGRHRVPGRRLSLLRVTIRGRLLLSRRVVSRSQEAQAMTA
ncbi:MAG: hypothetical protein R3D98_06945 [Candidatus Krumholzibacteriia bacterium]